jgi:hypothetical protein
MMAALRAQLARRNQVMAGKGAIATNPSQKPPEHVRRTSIAPRLNKPPSMLRAPGAAQEKVAEGDEDEAEGAGGEKKAMSSAVLSAYVSAHAQKTEKEDDWE